MSDIFDIMMDDEDEMPAELQAVVDQINELMGGSAQVFAASVLPEDLYALVFGQDVELTPPVEAQYPVGANFANIFDASVSGAFH